MAVSDIHECQCSDCKAEAAHLNKGLHGQMNLLISRLDEQQRRWYVAMESKRIGYGGDVLMSQITGMDEKTIRRGRRELDNSLAERPADKMRLPGAGRPRAEKKTRS
jgi:hypothetical protein